jgi:hypothetical protein
MAAVAFKSVVYLSVFGGLGYVLMKVAEPSEEKKKAIRGTGYSDPSSDEVKTKKALFLEKLKDATTDTPIYLQKPKSANQPTAAPKAPEQPTKREIN